MLKFLKRNFSKDNGKDNSKTDINQKKPEITEPDSISTSDVAKDTENSEAPKSGGFFDKLYAGLAKTRKQLFSGFSGVSSLFTGKVIIDDALFEELETHLLSADLGVDVTAE